MINIDALLTAKEIQQRLDFFNKTNDWSVFDDVPDIQQVNIMYPHYQFGYRAKEVAVAIDPRTS